MNRSSIKYTATIIFFIFTIHCEAQKNSFDRYVQDTIQLNHLSFKKVIALKLDSAIVMIDFAFFKEKLKEERKGCKKRIKSRKKIKNDKVVSSQLSQYEKQLIVLDSIYMTINHHSKKRDTVTVHFSVFSNVSSPFGGFLPMLLESKSCMLYDTKMQFQSFIVRQVGSAKNNSTHSYGATLYFLPGHENHFWSRWDFST